MWATQLEFVSLLKNDRILFISKKKFILNVCLPSESYINSMKIIKHYSFRVFDSNGAIKCSTAGKDRAFVVINFTKVVNLRTSEMFTQE